MSGRLIESFKVLSTLTAYRVVAAVSSTAMTVQYPESVAYLPLGITIDDVEATTDAIPVALNGKAKLLFNDAVTSGQLVAFDTSGRGIPYTLAATTTVLTLPTGIIGTLIGDTVAATGTVAQVLINPQLMR